MIASEARKITESNRGIYLEKIKEIVLAKIGKFAQLGFANTEYWCDPEYVVELSQFLKSLGYQISISDNRIMYITW